MDDVEGLQPLTGLNRVRQASTWLCAVPWRDSPNPEADEEAMTQDRRRPRQPGRSTWKPLRIAMVFTVVLALTTAISQVSASAELNRRVDLRVLVLSDASAPVIALTTQMDREGVPYTSVDISLVTLTQDYLENAATGEAYFQAVVVPSAASLSSSASAAPLAAFEAKYGVRQVDAYSYPGSPIFSVGYPSALLDGSPATVTVAGLAGAFSYLKGQFTIDNFDPVSYTHLTLPTNREV